MLSFRQKLLLSYLVIFLIFLAILFPFSHRMVLGVVNKALSDRTQTVITDLEDEPSVEAMVKHLETEGPAFFFRITLMKPDAELLYESHTETLLQPPDRQKYLDDHPEITQAIKEGRGYHEGYSYFLGQDLIYVATAFDFQGQTLIVRTAFPLQQVQELVRRFEFGFLTIGFFVLLFFGILAAVITYHLSRPIKKIIDAITPYQTGRTEELPEIRISNKKDEFGTLASTINQLTQRIKTQIDTLTIERNERSTILESLTEGVIAVDRHMRVVYANQTAIDMLEHPLIGQPFINAKQQEFHDLLASCQQQQEILAIASELGDKKKIYLDVIASPIEGGAILILQDKSIHYRILEMRKAFIANASHELRTPITIIQGFSEALHDHPDMDHDQIREITAKVINNCVRMASLIRNLLRLADIENLPRGNLQPVDLKPLVETCSELTKAIYPDAEFTLPDNDIEVLADPDLLQHAITNLLDNAAKYSEGPAKITITLDRSPDAAILQVSDKGIGIPAEDIDHIFDRFYTVNKAHSRRLGGSGLGLSIVRTIIEKHFGRISVTSKPGEGSTFTLILPVNIDELLS